MKGGKILLVPSTVDIERFNIKGVSPLPYDYVAYCGSLTIKKDGVDILIDSFSRLAQEKPDIDLVLIGKGDLEFEETAIRSQRKQANRTDIIGVLQLGLGIQAPLMLASHVLGDCDGRHQA